MMCLGFEPTYGDRMVGADKSNELWGPPIYSGPRSLNMMVQLICFNNGGLGRYCYFFYFKNEFVKICCLCSIVKLTDSMSGRGPVLSTGLVTSTHWLSGILVGDLG